MKSKTLLKFKSDKLVILAIILLGFTIGLSAGYIYGHARAAPCMEHVFIVRVIDGDTVELADGQRIRYLGIDTPEKGEFYADEATAKNKELVERKTVELQQGNRNKDEYGRLLRYVYVDGIFVNAELVAQGYAKAYIFDADERYSQILVQLEQYAKITKRGLWVVE